MTAYCKHFHWRIFVIVSFVCLQSAGAQLTVKISARQQLYDRMLAPSDAVSATLKQNGRTLQTFLSSFDRTYIYSGPINDPWRNYTLKMHRDFYDDFTAYGNYAMQNTAEYAYDFGTDRYDPITNGNDKVVLVLKNIHKVSSNELIGFLHTEYTWQNGVDPYPAYYSIGLSYSNDNGNHWTFCGDIVRTYNAAADGRCNIGGAAYIVKDDYFYVYFNEVDSAFHSVVSVARANRTDVIAAARSRQIIPWSKYTGNNTWNAEACPNIPGSRPGLATEIIPLSLVSSNPSIFVDSHGDAAYCSSLGKYLFMVKAGWSLFLLESSDGLSWANPKLIAINDSEPHGPIPSYPYFASLSNDASDDCAMVGKNFYIFYLNILYPAWWPDCADPSTCSQCTVGNPPPCTEPPFTCRGCPIYIGNGCGYNYPGDCVGPWRVDGTDFTLWQLKATVGKER